MTKVAIEHPAPAETERSDGDHIHRSAVVADFDGKTIVRFAPDADNVWRFWFTDGTAFAVQCEGDCMEICATCL